MQHKFINCDLEKCIGCRICELVCSAVKEQGFNPILSRIRGVRIGFGELDMAITCRLCENPGCVRSCPKKALRASEETGVIIVDENKCAGCSWCIEACKFGVMIYHRDKNVMVCCDLCGMEPKCVDFCPTGALSFTTSERAGQSIRRKAVKELADARGV